MRSLADLTPDERSAYKIWQNKLADRTLSAQHHDQARREIDALLWKGPNAQVLALKAELAQLQARIERLEFHAGLADDMLPVPDKSWSEQRAKPDQHFYDGFVMPDKDKSRAEPRPAEGIKQSVNYVITVHEPDPKPASPVDVAQVTNSEEANAATAATATETRGRKKLRFIPQKAEAGGWGLLDREQEAFLECAPFKTRKEAKVFTDDLNAGVKPKFLRGIEIPGISDEVIPYVNDEDEDQIGETISRVTDDPSETVIQNAEVVEERPDGSDPDLGF